PGYPSGHWRRGRAPARCRRRTATHQGRSGRADGEQAATAQIPWQSASRAHGCADVPRSFLSFLSLPTGQPATLAEVSLGCDFEQARMRGRERTILAPARIVHLPGSPCRSIEIPVTYRLDGRLEETLSSQAEETRCAGDARAGAALSAQATAC